MNQSLKNSNKKCHFSAKLCNFFLLIKIILKTEISHLLICSLLPAIARAWHHKVTNQRLHDISNVGGGHSATAATTFVFIGSLLESWEGLGPEASPPHLYLNCCLNACLRKPPLVIPYLILYIYAFMSWVVYLGGLFLN